MKQLPTFLATIFALLLIAASPLRAETVHINIGLPIPSLPNTYKDDTIWWNKLSSWGVMANPQFLVDDGGASTSVQWQTTQALTNKVDGGIAESAFGYSDLVTQNGFYLLSGSVAEVVLSGLDLSRTYELTLYASLRNVAVKRGLTVTLQSSSGSSSESLILEGTVSAGDEKEIIFSNLTPLEDGRIVLSFSVPAGFDRGTLQAITLHSIPEPFTGTLLFFGVGATLLLRRRLKRGGKP